MGETLRREIDELTVVAQNFHAQHQPIANPAHAHLRLEPRVWRDHPGSLS